MTTASIQDLAQEGFPETSWTTIRKAGNPDPEVAQAALGRMAMRYRDALRHFLLQIGCPRQEVDDVLHDFLAGRLLQAHFLENVGLDRGLFRCFLRTCLRRFLISHQRSSTRRDWIEALDCIDEVAWSSGENQAARTLDRLWAEQVIANARARIRAEAAEVGRAEWCAAMETLIDAEPGAGGVQGVAQRLGMTPGAVSTASHRFRERLRWLIQEEVRLTVREPGDWKQELDHLVAALRS